MVSIDLQWEKSKLAISAVLLGIFGKTIQKCLLNSSPHFIRFLSKLLNLIGCRGNINVNFRKSLLLKNHK